MIPLVSEINKHLDISGRDSETGQLLVRAKLEIESLDRSVRALTNELDNMKSSWEMQNITIKSGIAY